MLDTAFRLDMLVDGMIIVELKSTEQNPVFAKQVKTYLTVTGLHVGVLVNFGMEKLKDGYARIVRDYSGPRPSEKISASPRLRVR